MGSAESRFLRINRRAETVSRQRWRLSGLDVMRTGYGCQLRLEIAGRCIRAQALRDETHRNLSLTYPWAFSRFETSAADGSRIGTAKYRRTSKLMIVPN